MSKVNDAVLVVEDDAALREALLDTLRAAGLTALAAADASSALQLLAGEDIGLVISDVHMPGANGYELLSSIKRLRPYLPVVLMTAFGTVAQAVAAMREGATDYIVKPFDAQALIDMAQRQLAARVTPNELIASDPESKRLVGLARKIAENDATVLITGESGTGKEVYARFIRDAPTSLLSPSIARPSPRTCSKPVCSAMRREPSPAPLPRMPGNSSKRKGAPCCSMRFRKWIWGCRPRSCAYCRSVKSSASAAPAPSAWMCA
jgi:two-component system response regulator FlrC